MQPIFQVTLPSLLPSLRPSSLVRSKARPEPRSRPPAPPATRAQVLGPHSHPRDVRLRPAGCTSTGGPLTPCALRAPDRTHPPPRFPECHLNQLFQEPACDWQETTAHSSSRGNTGQGRTLAGAAWPCPGPSVRLTRLHARLLVAQVQATLSPGVGFSFTDPGGGWHTGGCRAPSRREGHTSKGSETSWRPSPGFLVEYPDFKCWQVSFLRRRCGSNQISAAPSLEAAHGPVSAAAGGLGISEVESGC